MARRRVSFRDRFCVSVDKLDLFATEHAMSGDPEQRFVDFIATQASEGNGAAQAEILKRLHTGTKATFPEYEVDIPEGASPSEKASAVLQAIVTGDIPADVGVTLISGIKDLLQIAEFDEFERRLKQVEEAL